MLLKKIIPCLTIAFLAACGDDTSDFATRPSSGVTPKSSDSETSVSSGSVSDLSRRVVGCKTETKDKCVYGELLDERDGQTYKTVKMGEHWWMAENLNYALLQPTEGLDSSSFCYNDSLEYCDTYGRLYLKSGAMDSAGTWSDGGFNCGNDVKCSPKEPVRGVCPEGWHLPNDDDWKALFAVVGDSSLVPLALKSASGWWVIDNGIDAFGFAILPSGIRRNVGDYYSIGKATSYWSSTELFRSTSSFINIYLNEGYDYWKSAYKDYAFSVRCLKD